jgi:hypothetical protein
MKTNFQLLQLRLTDFRVDNFAVELLVHRRREHEGDAELNDEREEKGEGEESKREPVGGGAVSEAGEGKNSENRLSNEKHCKRRL